MSHLLRQHLTRVAKTRTRVATDSRIRAAELQQPRQLVVLVLGGLS